MKKLTPYDAIDVLELHKQFFGEEVEASLNMAISAIERDLQKDVEKKGEHVYACPVCHTKLSDMDWDWCPWCGTHLFCGDLDA